MQEGGREKKMKKCSKPARENYNIDKSGSTLPWGRDLLKKREDERERERDVYETVLSWEGCENTCQITMPAQQDGKEIEGEWNPTLQMITVSSRELRERVIRAGCTDRIVSPCAISN
jgi:hypothetical protein